MVTTVRMEHHRILVWYEFINSLDVVLGNNTVKHCTENLMAINLVLVKFPYRVMEIYLLLVPIIITPIKEKRIYTNTTLSKKVLGN